MELEQNAGEFRKAGLNVAAISYDSIEILHDFAQRKNIHFALLSDPHSKIIREVGILNEDIPRNNPFFGVPHPVTYILDNKGVIVAKYFEEDYKQRFTAADILVQRYGITPEPARSEVEGKQLKAITSVSNSMVRGGQRIALIIDIELKPEMHVYAPGVQGYIPIDWKLKESEAWTAHPVTYPATEKLFLKAINETVPVYKGRLRLTRDLTIAQEGKVKSLVDQSGTFAVDGTLRYQACDERQCFIPQELPLKWTLHFEGLDRERVPEALQRKTR